jgi:S-formylglutathione hydrolase FrmB
VFGHFEDISGDLGPNLGDKEKTIRTLYHGDAAAWAEHDPLTILDRRPDYHGVSGWFADGTDEPFHVNQAVRLKAAADRAGIRTHLQISPGEHNWMFGATAFADALPWLADQLDLPLPPAAPTGTP